MLELAPGRLFNFPSREGGTNSKGGRFFEGGRLFRFPNLSLNITLSLFQVKTNWDYYNKSGSSLSLEIQISVRDRYLLFKLLH